MVKGRAKGSTAIRWWSQVVLHLLCFIPEQLGSIIAKGPRKFQGKISPLPWSHKMLVGKPLQQYPSTPSNCRGIIGHPYKAILRATGIIIAKSFEQQVLCEGSSYKHMLLELLSRKYWGLCIWTKIKKQKQVLAAYLENLTKIWRTALPMATSHNGYARPPDYVGMGLQTPVAGETWQERGTLFSPACGMPRGRWEDTVENSMEIRLPDPRGLSLQCRQIKNSQEAT